MENVQENVIIYLHAVWFRELSLNYYQDRIKYFSSVCLRTLPITVMHTVR